ncbi:hypothetical protein LCGC14_1071470 [marine sediment metagenome]|uniref:FAD-dependent oxidoreductase 2 FAD binding domain-containing protein n=1 Tax=marine sediment metagenome TaxID=412755 RepID=A0A0F9MI14_9ZZZZ
MYPSFGNLVPRDIASRAVKLICDEGRGVGFEIDGQKLGVYLDFADAIKKHGLDAVEEKYGNLFDMYQRITASNPYQTPMRIYPAVHYTMGGLWVDYNLMTTIDGLFAGGEANFSDHGSNRLGASALMQGLADGYFVLPTTVSDYLAKHKPINPAQYKNQIDEAMMSASERIEQLMNAPEPSMTPDDFHRQVGQVLWDACGMAREKEHLLKAIAQIRDLREQFWQKVKVSGSKEGLNQTLERAGRVADFLELTELMCIDALDREESCGCHAREEHLTAEGEAERNDTDYSYVAAWKYSGDVTQPILYKEHLHFDFVRPSIRNYQ